MQKKLGLSLILMSIVGSLYGEYQPDTYHESNVRQFNTGIQELYRLGLSGTEKILDISSGDGRLSCYIAQKYIPKGQLIGIDNSAHMVSFAAAHQIHSNVSYVCADAVDYVVPDEFDAIVSFSALHWVSDYTKALDNIARSLKPRGKALLCHGVGMPPFPPIVNKLLETEKWNKYKNDAHLLAYPSLLEVAHAIDRTGLTLESLEVKRHFESIPVDTLIKNWLSMPLLDFIPLSLREDFAKEVVQEFINEYPLNDKNELLHWAPVIVIVLKK